MQKIIVNDNSSEKSVQSNISLICYICNRKSSYLSNITVCGVFLCPSISDFVAALLAKNFIHYSSCDYQLLEYSFLARVKNI